MPFIERPNAKIYYEIWGDRGPWVTLVNGHTRTMTDFRNLGKMLNVAGYRIIALDNRASGKSEVTAGFTLADMAEDVVTIWDKVGVTSTALVGISMGGSIAQSIAANHPGLLSSLILVSTSADARWIVKTDKEWGSDIASVEAKLQSYFAPAFISRNKLLIQAMAKQVLNAIDAKEFKENATLQRQALDKASTRDLLPSIKAPTLVVHGDIDPIIDPKAAQELVEGIVNARLAMFPGIGHLLLAESANEFYRTVMEFLAENRPA